MAEPRALLLLSSGIDSPVAGALLAREGIHVDFAHMDNRPFTDDTTYNKTLKLARVIAKMDGRPHRLFVLPHGDNAQAEIAKHCNRHMQCVLCRRFMYRTAVELARREGYDFIATGENLGQVASQTLDNLRTESATLSVPVLRPLIGWDKVEIVDTAKEMGTYETSIEPGLCCLLAPKKPAIHADPARAAREEEKLDVNGIVERELSGMEVIEL